MTREEIDLREKIAAEIMVFVNSQELSDDGYWGLMRAAGVVRQKINHSPSCPCSICGGRSNG